MRPLRVLVGCERSGKVRDAFRRRGHEAWSNDLPFDEVTGEPIEPGGEFSEFHLKMDVRDAVALQLHGVPKWDIGIFFPTCTFLTNSGIKHLYRGGRKENGPNFDRWRSMITGAELFWDCLHAPIPRVAVENPWMHPYAASLLGRPHQILQPHEFGHGETKGTGLHLRGLPPLFATLHDQGREARIHKMLPSPDRGIRRSETFDGIAEAMADQWGDFVAKRIEKEAA